MATSAQLAGKSRNLTNDLEKLIIGQQEVKERTLRPTSDQVKSLGLKPGKNKITYKVHSEV